MDDVDHLLTKVRGKVAYQEFERPLFVEEPAKPAPAVIPPPVAQLIAAQQVQPQPVAQPAPVAYVPPPAPAAPAAPAWVAQPAAPVLAAPVPVPVAAPAPAPQAPDLNLAHLVQALAVIKAEVPAASPVASAPSPPATGGLSLSRYAPQPARPAPTPALMPDGEPIPLQTLFELMKLCRPGALPYAAE